jgi:serine O-acetyltransferase
MLEILRMDLKRWVVPGQIADDSALTMGTVLRLFYQYMPVRAIALFRLASWFKQQKIPFFPGFLQRMNYFFFGLEIPSGADIGGGLYIAHPIGTVIMPRRIGKNCTIIAAITIGMRNEWAFPDIGDEVFIGAGARVLGGIRIGNQVNIGANSVVIQDVPDGATVVGAPGKVIKVYGKPVQQAGPVEAQPVVN